MITITLDLPDTVARKLARMSELADNPTDDTLDEYSDLREEVQVILVGFAMAGIDRATHRRLLR